MIRKGDILGGRFEIRDKLGAGAQGEVFRALDQRDGTAVAVKVLRHEVSNEEFRERMAREADAMGKLEGTSAVRLVEFGTEPRGITYLAMELLQGEGLDQHLTHRKNAGRPLSSNEVLELLEPVAGTLQLAHEAGIVHRDLKPSNIFIHRTATLLATKVLDFGLAKLFYRDPRTRTGMVAGTKAYIPPEAFTGNQALIDHRVDIYALGVLVFVCFAGRTPFDSKLDWAPFLREIRRPARPKLSPHRSDLPDAVDTWLEQALAIDRDQRFFSMKETWSSLSRALSHPRG